MYKFSLSLVIMVFTTLAVNAECPNTIPCPTVQTSPPAQILAQMIEELSDSLDRFIVKFNETASSFPIEDQVKISKEISPQVDQLDPLFQETFVELNELVEKLNSIK